MKKPENISKFLMGGRNEEALKAFYQPASAQPKQSPFWFRAASLDSNGKPARLKG